jgi:hypothetical protein
MRRALSVSMMTVCVPGVLCAQGWVAGHLNPLGSEPAGLHLDDVTASASYFSAGLTDAFVPSLNGANLSSDVAISAGATIGWNRVVQRSSVSVVYSPSYSGRLHYTQWNSFSHSLAINANRDLGQKWKVSLSATASVGTADNFLFSPTLLSSLAAVPVSFDDLAAAMLTGQYTNNQLASILTGAPIIETPAGILLYGYHSLNTAVQGNLSYEHSSRLRISFGAGAGRNQHLSSKADANYPNLINQATSATANAALSYSLTPRTQIGGGFTSGRTFSPVAEGYAHSGSVSFSRRMGRGWLVQLHGGVGIFQPIRSAYASPSGPQYLAGGNLAYKTFSHSFMVSIDRSLASSFALGGGNARTAQASWQWQRPGMRWGLSANVAQQQLDGLILIGTSSWRGSAGINLALNSQTALNGQYSYMSYSGASTGSLVPYSQAHSGVQLSVVWSPRGRTRMH